MRYLTKSRFALALTCPTKLEYEGNAEFVNADFDNEFLKSLAEGGHQVGALAKCLFPEGIEVDDSGHDAQVEATERYMAREVVTLFEAAIRVGRLFIRADLLHKQGNVIDLYEVKAKGFDPTDPDAEMLGRRGGFTSSMKPYLYDVAFQRYVLKRAFPTATIRAHLVMPNKAATCSQDGLAQRLTLRKKGRQVTIDVDPSLRDGTLARKILCIVPVDRYLDRLEQLPMTMGGWVAAFAEGIEDLARRLDVEPYPPRLGSHCKSCQFRASAADLAAGKRDGRLHCMTTALDLTTDQLSCPTVFDLYGRAQTEALLGERKVLLADMESEDVQLVQDDQQISASHRQWLHREQSLHGDT